MLMLYFSGTGNSRYIAQQFSRRIQADCHSIEEAIDFDRLIGATDTVAFCYPIYGSCVPRILREFTAAHAGALANKKLVILCTQMMFSGDGARAFTDLLAGSAQRVLYAEHFNMPNNICNLWIFPIREGERRRKLRAADKKLDRVCSELEQGVVRLRGWSKASRLLGQVQNASWPMVEEKNRATFQADGDCTRCGLCVQLCPMHNLTLTDDGIEQRGNCILCYRCVNACPCCAATVLLHSKPQRQYRGIAPFSINSNPVHMNHP